MRGAAKSGQYMVCTLDILRVGVNPQIHIFGIAGFGMANKGQASDNEVPYPVFVQEPEHVLEICYRIYN